MRRFFIATLLVIGCTKKAPSDAARLDGGVNDVPADASLPLLLDLPADADGGTSAAASSAANSAGGANAANSANGGAGAGAASSTADPGNSAAAGSAGASASSANGANGGGTAPSGASSSGGGGNSTLSRPDAPYPQSRVLCTAQTTKGADGAEVVWSSRATTATVAQAVEAVTAAGKKANWSVKPAGAAVEARGPNGVTVEVFPSTEPDPRFSCGAALKPGEKTIVVVARRKG